MELDRKYQGLNDIKITGIDAYMNRNQSIPSHPDEIIPLTDPKIGWTLYEEL
jgi:hypothetical protein